MSDILISDELKEALLDQWVEEKTNSSIYISIGAWFKNKGFDNLGKFFMDASLEEDGHAKQIVDIMTDLNIDFMVKEIPSFEGVMDCTAVAGIFLSREEQTTDSLNELKKLSMEENPIIEEFSRKMISQQQAEMEEALSFFDKVQIVGNDYKMLLLWDLSLK